MKSVIFATLFALSIQSHAYSSYSCGGDRVVAKKERTEVRDCKTAGVCYADDYDIVTGVYTNFYGQHWNCAGTEKKYSTDYLCQAQDQSTYDSSDEGAWGYCLID